MDSRKSLLDSAAVRYTLFGVVVAAMVAVALLTFLHEPAEPEPEDDRTRVSDSRVMRPTEPADSDREQETDADAEEPAEPVRQPVTDLSLEEQDRAMSTSVDGFLAWYDVDPTESLEDRTARLDAFFTDDSEHRADAFAPDGMRPEDGIYTRATLNWSEAVSADSQEVRVLLGVRTSGQIGSEVFGGSPEDQMVISGDGYYLVVLTPEDGTWRISTITQQRG